MTEIHPAAQPYYDRLTLSDAVEIAREVIDEWSYEQDAHGYCHRRAVLLRLVEAVERDSPELHPAAGRMDPYYDPDLPAGQFRHAPRPTLRQRIRHAWRVVTGRRWAGWTEIGATREDDR